MKFDDAIDRVVASIASKLRLLFTSAIEGESFFERHTFTGVNGDEFGAAVIVVPLDLADTLIETMETSCGSPDEKDTLSMKLPQY